MRRNKHYRIAFVVAIGIGICSDSLSAAEPPAIKKAATTRPLVLEVRKQEWGSYDYGTDQDLATLITEVEAKPGDKIGELPESDPRFGGRPFAVEKLLDDKHVRVRVSSNLVGDLTTAVKARRDDSGAGTFALEAVLSDKQVLFAWTPSHDAGTKYTVKISDLDQAPAVVADESDLIARIAAHASVVKDERGSVQSVGPPRMPRYRKRANDDAAKKQWQALGDNELRDIAKLKNLRQLSLRTHGSHERRIAVSQRP